MSNFTGFIEPGAPTQKGEIWECLKESKRLNSIKYYKELIKLRNLYFDKFGKPQLKTQDEQIKFERYVHQESKTCHSYIIGNDTREVFYQVLFYPKTTADELYENRQKLDDGE